MDVQFSSLRGEVVELPGGVTVVNDCYNANPMSMRAAIDHLAGALPSAVSPCSGRWPSSAPTPSATTARSGARGRARGGRARGGRRGALRLRRGLRRRGPPGATPEEAALLEEVARPGDRVLVKGSRHRPGAGPGLIDARRDRDRGSASLLICMFLGPRFIEYLRLKEFGQHIREEGPEAHHGKAGTPTMGGIAILLAVCVPFLILSDYRAVDCRARDGLAMAALDLRRRHRKRRRRLARRLGANEAAHPGPHRDRIVARGQEYLELADALQLRVVDASIDLGLAYPVLIFLVLAGATNGVNLTDGLDGLAAGCCAIVSCFTAMTFITQGQEDLALLCACLVGACVGFLWFNSFPASVFMGDTGSPAGRRDRRARGDDADRAAADRDRRHLRDRGAVAIQVFSFQRFRKRVFLMAPIHHHFELMGGRRRRSSCASGSSPRSAPRSGSRSTRPRST